MQVGLRQFDAGTLEWLRGAVTQPGATRSSLARDLCDRSDWRDSSGARAEASARKLLPRLAERLSIPLPAPGRSIAPGAAVAAPPVPDQEIRCTLEELGEVRLVPVGDRESRRRWEAMIDAWHPLGWARSPGRQLRYWIRSSRHGLLGGIGFASASWHQKARDRWIGWCDDARVAHLNEIVCHQRFLLCPWVVVPNLASRVLAMATARLADDWAAAGGSRPLLVYTYVGPDHAGSCYAAAGWERCGEPTSGAPPGQARPGPRRSVWMKPLAADWKPRLCAVPDRPAGAPATVYLAETADWADHEYGRLRHPDGRLRERIKRMGRAWLTHLGAPLPAIFPDKAARKAAYRVLSNDRVTMDHILESHQAATAERCAREQVVLAIQDTTTLNYDGLAATTGRVGIGGRGTGAQGLLAHVGLAVTPQGRTLGVYTLDANFRDSGDDSEKESRRWLEGLEQARTLQAACPGTRVVTVCDREADIWEMFQQASQTGTDLLVRASRSRKRRVITDGGVQADLWAHVAGQPACAAKRLTIDACGGPRRRTARKTDLELRACRVRLAPPKAAADPTPVDLLAVSATETTPPDGADPLHWLLLTTAGEPTPHHAQQVVRWYEARWAIETWFSVLKTGTRLMDRQLDTADDLRKCLVFDAITACHVHDLNFMARTEPDTPAHAVIDPDMIECLYIFLRLLGIRRISRAPPDREHLDIRTFVIDLANAAGFDSTKRQPLPGTRKLWEAWVRFQPAWIQYRGMKQMGWTAP